MDILLGAFVLFLATTAGAGAVMLLGCMDGKRNAAMLAFSAGAMAYTSVEMFTEAYGPKGDVMAIAGVGMGIAALALLERSIPHIHLHIRKKELEHSKKKALLIGGAIAIHNIPEGLAVATSFAASNPLGWFVTMTMAVQDAPEGMLVSAPLACYGMGKRRAFLFGAFSGAVEAVSAIVGFAFLNVFAGLVPVSLAFSAGAMAYVIFVELLPDAFRGGMERIAAASFIAGVALAAGIAAMFAV